MSKGILIICAGHAYYGRMAMQLAVSLKVTEPDIKIALVHGGNAMAHLSLFNLDDWFDYIIPVPQEAITRKGNTEWIKAKTFMYDLSPFDETIYLDADTLKLPRSKPSEMFEQLKDTDFTIQNRGYVSLDSKDDPKQWAKYSDIKQAYGFTDEKFYKIFSEFVYFEKCDRMETFFNAVKENYDDLKMPHQKFAGGIPDEICFSIAMMQTEIYPHSDNFTPIYWQTIEKRIPQDLNEYFALSAGGKITGEWTKNNYDRLVQHYFNSAGLRQIWKLQNKRRFLPERAEI